jgi:hypothetical protein
MRATTPPSARTRAPLAAMLATLVLATTGCGPSDGVRATPDLVRTGAVPVPSPAPGTPATPPVPQDG